MKNITLLLLIISLSACSIFQSGEKETQQNTGNNDSSDEVYVFDEVSETDVNTTNTKKAAKEIEQVKSEDTSTKTKEDLFDESVVNNETKINYSANKYFLQFGAFSTLNRAEKFVNENNSQINLVLSIIYDSNTELYTVRSSAYNTKPEVEKIKNDFWKRNLYKDAFIVTQ